MPSRTRPPSTSTRRRNRPEARAGSGSPWPCATSCRTSQAVSVMDKEPSPSRRRSRCGRRRAATRASATGPQPTIQAMPISRTSPSRRESRVNNASIPAVRAIRAPPEGRGALPCERLMGISLIKRRPGAGWDRDRARGTSKKASGRKRRPAGGSCVTVCADRFPYARPGQRPGRRRPFPRACP